MRAASELSVDSVTIPTMRACVCVRAGWGGSVPQQSHVFLPLDGVTVDVTFCSRTGLLNPRKHGVAGTQTDLKTHTRVSGRGWWNPPKKLQVNLQRCLLAGVSFLPEKLGAKSIEGSALVMSLHLWRRWEETQQALGELVLPGLSPVKATTLQLSEKPYRRTK